MPGILSPLVSTLAVTLLLHPNAGEHNHADPGATNAARQQAGQAFKQRKYVDAAARYETLWRQQQEPRDLFNAGLAWFAAGEHALAILRFESYIDLGDKVPAEYIARAESQLQRARQDTVEVAITVVPADAAKGELVLRGTRKAKARGLPQRTLEFRPPRAYGAATRAVTTIRVDPGQWDMVLEAPGYRTATRAMTVAAGQSGFTMDIELQADPNAAAATAPAPAPGNEVVFALPPEAADFVDGDVTITATQTGATGATNTQRCTIPVLFPEPPGTCAMALGPGAWQVTAEGPGLAPYASSSEFANAASQRVTLPVAPAVSPEEGDTLEDAAPGAPGVPLKTRLKLSRGLAIGGTVVAASGLAFTIVGDVRYGEAENDVSSAISLGECARPTEDGRSCQATLIAPIRLRSAGLGLLGGAAGLYASAVTARYDVKPIVWYAEIGTGAVLSLGGIIWLAARTPALDTLLSTPEIGFNDVSTINGLTAERMAGAFFLGAGVGLVGGAVTGLMVQRKVLGERAAGVARGLSPYFGRGAAGLSLSGRF